MRDAVLRVPVNPDERALIERLARKEGECMSVVIRRLIRQAALAGQMTGMEAKAQASDGR
jgi:hypothetical protein